MMIRKHLFLIGLILILALTSQCSKAAEHIYLMKSVISPKVEDHAQLIAVLLEAKEGDTVTIKVAGYGGSVLVANAIINAMHESKAYIVADVMSGAYSAHAYISSAADEIKLRSGGFLMFHTVQQKTLRGQKPVMLKDMDTGLLEMVENILYKNAINVLTKEQLTNMITKNYEYYLTPKGLIEVQPKKRDTSIDARGAFL